MRKLTFRTILIYFLESKNVSRIVHNTTYFAITIVTSIKCSSLIRVVTALRWQCVTCTTFVVFLLKLETLFMLIDMIDKHDKDKLKVKFAKNDLVAV